MIHPREDLMPERDKLERLRRHLEAAYRRRTGRSRELFRRAGRVMVGGGSHSIRLFRPHPVFIEKASGARVFDFDGNDYVDYWQGHYANILGHNPELVFRDRQATDRASSGHTGFESVYQVQLAELLLERLRARGHRVRFTTSGTLATMYAVMLSQGYTGRELVLKAGGGWHGASPYLLKGVRFHPGMGFHSGESFGIPAATLRKTLVTRFNDPDDLAAVIRRHGDRIACFIVEPFIGVGGFLPASREYLAAARELTARHGIVLVFDEIISGFRFCASGVQSLYGVRPDLTAFGKIIGGGHAVAAIVGREGIMRGCLKGDRRHVSFEGGTFSAHPEYMKAGLAMIRWLVAHEDGVYPELGRKGDELRSGIKRVFEEAGFPAVTTGGGNDVVPGGSLFMVHFPVKGAAPATPEDLQDPARSDVRLREEILKLALLIEGVHVVHGGGAVSVAHGRDDIARTLAAYGAAAELFRRWLG
jgi:glutamate-1-semialdehyde 2,1-aminomutase